MQEDVYTLAATATSAEQPKVRARSRYFVALALLLLATVAIGFSSLDRLARELVQIGVEGARDAYTI